MRLSHGQNTAYSACSNRNETLSGYHCSSPVTLPGTRPGGEGQLPDPHSPTDFTLVLSLEWGVWSLYALLITLTCLLNKKRPDTSRTAFRLACGDRLSVYSLRCQLLPLVSIIAPLTCCACLRPQSTGHRPRGQPSVHGDEGIRTPGFLLAKQALSH